MLPPRDVNWNPYTKENLHVLDMDQKIITGADTGFRKGGEGSGLVNF